MRNIAAKPAFCVPARVKTFTAPNDFSSPLHTDLTSVAIIEGSSGKSTQARKEPRISKSHTIITSLSHAVAIPKERSPSV